MASAPPQLGSPGFSLVTQDYHIGGDDLGCMHTLGQGGFANSAKG